MSTPPENTPDPSAAGRDTSGSRATGPGSTSGAAASQDGPWATHPATGQHERLSPPAPMIELDTPVQAEPVKPLGPRRLARLQREMAEHTREVQEAERSNGGAVDDALLAKQQRLADLAVRAAAANDRDRRDAQRALAVDEGSGATDEPAAPGNTSVTFPGMPARKAEGVVLGSGQVDPSAWPAVPVDGGPGPATTQIPIYTAPETSSRAVIPAAGGDGHVTAANPATVHPAPDEAVNGAEQEAHAASGVERGSAAGPGAAPTEAGERAPGAAASSSPEDGAHQAPPGTPVRAVDAQGLDLLDAGAYKRRGAGARWLIGLLLVVLGALAVVLVMFIL